MLNLLSIDLGASSGRVMRAGFDGNVLNLKVVHRFNNQPLYVSNKVCWNIYSIFQEIKSGIAEAARAYGAIRALAVDSWAVDFGLLDVKGNLISLPRHYRDPRNAHAMERVVSRIGKETLFQRTGIQLMPINTLFQLFACHEEDLQLLITADKLLLIPDLVNFFLTGECRAEFTNATTTQFLRADNGTWDSDLLLQLELPHHLLPMIVQPGTILGPLNDNELLQSTSLTSTEVLHTASHDTAAAVMSVPHTEESYVYICSGTWSLIGTTLQKPLVNEHTRACNFTNEGGYGNYRLLKNVMGLWLFQETLRTLKAEGKSSDMDTLLLQARSAPAFSFLFDLDDPRLLQPGVPQTIRQICRETGQSVPKDWASLIRGIFESLALKYRSVLEQLEMVTGKSYNSIHVVGGGTQNSLLSQFTANATRKTVMAGPVEASAMGNALVQLLALGEVKSGSDMNEIVRNSVTPVLFTPSETKKWDFAYETFQGIVRKQSSSYSG